MQRTRVFLQPYHQGSRSAKALANALGIKRLRVTYSQYKARESDLIINWGHSVIDDRKFRLLSKENFLNYYSFRAANKEMFFTTVSQNDASVNLPPFTTSPYEALNWAKAGKNVVSRPKISSGGVDIRFSEDYNNLTVFFKENQQRIFTCYIPKKKEFRVNIVRDKILNVSQKVLRKDIDPKDVDFRVRNHDNGFIFQRNNLEVPPEVLTQALSALKAVELDFGGVDVIWNELQNKAYVLEINTAPGIEGETLDAYVEAFREVIDTHHA